MSLPGFTMLGRSKSSDNHQTNSLGLKFRYPSRNNAPLNPIPANKPTINNNELPPFHKMQSTPVTPNQSKKLTRKRYSVATTTKKSRMPLPKPRHSFSVSQSNTKLKQRSLINKIMINTNQKRQSHIIKAQSPLPRPSNAPILFEQQNNIEEKNTLFDQMMALQVTMKGLGDMVRKQDNELKQYKETNLKLNEQIISITKENNELKTKIDNTTINKLKEQINLLADENEELRLKLNESRKDRNSAWQEMEFYKLAAKTRKDKVIFLTAQLAQGEQQKNDLASQTENLLLQLALEKKKSHKLSKKIKKFTSLHLQSIKNRKLSIDSLTSPLKLSAQTSLSKRKSISLSSYNDISLSSLNTPSTLTKKSSWNGFDNPIEFDPLEPDILEIDEENEIAYKQNQIENIERETIQFFAELEEQTKQLLGAAEELDQRTNKRIKKGYKKHLKKKSNLPEQIRSRIKFKNENIPTKITTKIEKKKEKIDNDSPTPASDHSSDEVDFDIDEEGHEHESSDEELPDHVKRLHKKSKRKLSIPKHHHEEHELEIGNHSQINGNSKQIDGKEEELNKIDKEEDDEREDDEEKETPDEGVIKEIDNQLKTLKKNDASTSSILDLFAMKMKLEEGSSDSDNDKEKKRRESVDLNNNEEEDGLEDDEMDLW